MRLTAAPAIAAPAVHTDRRAAVAALTRTAAMGTFYAAVVLSPFRARILIDERNVPPIFTDYTNLILYWNQILVIAVLGLWALSLLIQPRRIDLAPLLIRIPVALIAVAVFVPVPFSTERSLALYNAVAIVGFMAMGFYVLNEVKSISQVLPAIGLMIVVQAIVAIAQVTSQESFGLIPLGELDLDPADAGRSVLWTEGAPRLLRGYGLSAHPNILGGVLAAALLVLLAGLTRFRETPMAILCGAFGVGVAAVFMTFSRSAALGLAAGLVFAFLLLLIRRDWRTMAPWLAACVVAVMVTAPLVRPYTEYLDARVNPTDQPAGSTEERSLTEREVLARQTKDIFLDNAVTGVGAGVLPTAMKEAYPDSTYLFGPAHIAILVVAVETGILGVTAYGVLMLAPFLLLWLRRRRLTPELIGLSGAVVALTVVALLDYYTWSLNAGRLWFWLVLGLWVVAYRRSEEGRAHV